MTTSSVDTQNKSIIPADTQIVASGLPDDVLYSIFSWLPRPQDIFSVLLTNRRFSEFVSNYRPLWANLLRPHFPYFFPILQNPKENYQRFKNIDNNIRSQYNFRERLLDIDHVTNFAVEGNRLCACLLEGSIKVWDAQSGKKLHTLRNIGVCLNGLALRGDVLCSNDGKDIIIWDLETETKRHTLKAHRDTIHSLITQKNALISSSSDSVRVWDLESGEELKVWNDGKYSISSHAVQEDTVFIAFKNELKAFDITSGEELYTLPGHEYEIHRLYVQGTTLVSCDRGSHTKIWDLESRKQRHAWKWNDYNNYRLTSIGDALFVGGADKNNQWIHVWDLKSGKMLPPVPCGWDAFGGLASHGGRLFTSQSRHIKVYDFNFPSLSSYDKQTLEQNLSLLKEMTTADVEQAKTLAKKLHPDFQERLRQHAFKCSGSFELTTDVIFRVQTEVIAELLLDRIHGKDQKRVSELLDGMDNKSAKLLYNYLYCECASSIGENWGEHAFHGEPGYPASMKEKEQAVLEFKKFLIECWGPDLPLLLVDLGVVSKEEYSQKLQCKPEDLKNRGILSPADLQALGILNAPPIARLEAPRATPDQPKHMQLGEKRKRVVDVLKKLSEGALKRYQESENFGVTLFTDEKDSPIGQEFNPWAVFQKQFNEDRALLEEICGSPKKLSEDNGVLIEKANALIDQFNALDRDYQILKLRAYIHQRHIQEKWNALKVSSLVDFARQNPDTHLFMMGN